MWKRRDAGTDMLQWDGGARYVCRELWGSGKPVLLAELAASDVADDECAGPDGCADFGGDADGVLIVGVEMLTWEGG